MNVFDSAWILDDLPSEFTSQAHSFQPEKPPRSSSPSLTHTHTHTYCNNWSEATFDLPHLVANYLTNNYSLHFYLFHSYYIASIFP